MPSSWQKKQFVETLYSGGVVAYPTEAVFGLGCHPLDEVAVTKLLAIKKRSWRKGLILIGSEFSQLASFLLPIPAELYEKIHSPQKRPTTWLLPANEECPSWLTGEHKTLAVRLVEHDLAREMCVLSGTALVSTSANISGQMAIKTAWQARLKFNKQGVSVLNGRVGSRSEPSQILDPLMGERLR